MKDYLKLIDVHTSGPRYDVTPLFADHEAFSALIEDVCRQFEAGDIDFIAGIDALGFIMGTAVAARMKKGIIAIRKGDKLPVDVHRVAFTDYSGTQKSLEVRMDVIHPGARVLLVDEWIETGSQVTAAVGLIESQGGVIAGIATINIDDNERTRKLKETYRCFEAWEGEV